ncbi:aldehyde reductase I (Alcohol dehydrogenase) [Trichosporon asahii var. asahii CBS 8904]|uniref:Aldehyde reductase I (Alcohol dehydrogenase) n=1 Tax=Trichosporon asahii var. asahii (strain CBS 8904) TaxID=1220162 RepID=K1VYX9_TRIAC|nr:aldehyde reductase I (Alcohol dehydrogenase) [Trichosporon asahii var. asahii CBS 8904]
MSNKRELTLNNGVKIPQIGFGTWQAKPGEVEKAVTEALKAGYRHIDAALIYGNQNEVAAGIKDSGVDRKDIFITSKLWNNSHRPEHVEADLDTTLKQLGTDYLDLYLIHWPVPFQPGKELAPSKDGEALLDIGGPSIVDTWKEVVRISKETKKVRAIGVSNFTIEHLEKIIKATGVVPAVNQVEAHPTLIQPELFKYLKEKNIHLTAYSPLGNNVTGKPRDLDAEPVKKIAEKLGKTAAQVLIGWGLKQDFIEIPKSVTPDRIRSNFEAVELDDEDFKAISEWGKANYTRGNIPAEYKPKVFLNPGAALLLDSDDSIGATDHPDIVWPINIFNEPEEKNEKNQVWGVTHALDRKRGHPSPLSLSLRLVSTPPTLSSQRIVMSTAGSLPAKRRGSSSERALAEIDRPAGFTGALVKHGKYVAAGLLGIWWFDLPAAVAQVRALSGWGHTAFSAAVGLQLITVSLFLYLVVYLPWYQGALPNYPKWQKSRRLRVIVPLLFVTILSGWSALAFALSHASHSHPRGPIRSAIRAALGLEEKLEMSRLAAMCGVYILMFGVLGFIPAPPMRKVKRSKSS